MILIHIHKYRKGSYMVRKLVMEILVKYQRDHSYINILLNDRLENSNLSRIDKDLVTKIVYGTIQNKLFLEYQLAPYIEGKKVHVTIKMILLMSLYQAIFLDKIPTYAIIDEAVTLATTKDRNSGRFVNAILRTFIRNGIRSIEGNSFEETLSIETSHPLWLVKMFVKQYGIEDTKKICFSNNEVPLKIARVNTLKTTREELLKDTQLTKGVLSLEALCFASGNIANTSYYQDGLVTIQDESSQLVAPFLDPQEQETILDMCCAPGSKTTHVAALMNNTGNIVAYDVFPHKIELVKQNCHRLAVTNVTCMVGDSTQIEGKECFDRILLDAPCSGLGVLKRKPEIKYHDSSMMDTLLPLQAKLLEKAYDLLKKNGKMVYSTCTINKKENEFMIQKFLEKHKDIKIIEERKILPFTYNSDGFYMCKLEKVEK